MEVDVFERFIALLQADELITGKATQLLATFLAH